MNEIIIDFKAWCYRYQNKNNFDIYDGDEIVNNYMCENKLYGQEIFDELIKAFNEIIKL